MEEIVESPFVRGRNNKKLTTLLFTCEFFVDFGGVGFE